MSWRAVMTTDDDFGEERANLRQRIGELETQVEKMTVRLSDDDLNTLSLRCAHVIEDQFVQSHASRAQRLAKVQLIVREILRELATGKTRWDAWQPGSFGPAPSEPEVGGGHD